MDAEAPEYRFDLPGESLLRTNLGRWHVLLTPVLEDSVGWESAGRKWLGELDQAVTGMLDDAHSHPIPQFALHPTSLEDADRLTLASWLAALRAETLFQWSDCAGFGLHALSLGSTHVAAIIARSLLEIAGRNLGVHRVLVQSWGAWDQPSNPAQGRAGMSQLAESLWVARLGTRDTGSGSALPKPQNALTGIDRLDRMLSNVDVKGLYAQLCEVAHPNSEAHGVYWRRGNLVAGRYTVELSPGNSESPLKLDAVNAIAIGTWVCRLITRDLWSATVALSAGLSGLDSGTRTLLGLSGPQGRNELCECGSGIKSKVCEHPLPSRREPDPGAPV